jgi:hypothetical protein
MACHRPDREREGEEWLHLPELHQSLLLQFHPRSPEGAETCWVCEWRQLGRK